ncbi:MAG: ABC transporter permease subunit [Epulopiscium sp.]|jgi:ABC-type transport system involved in multi-copper enzyme maturation permease subunit|nr:ABC transporter permease subunit [Candidatus Epulonipiscium sp.]
MEIKWLIQIEYKKMKLQRFGKQVAVANFAIIFLTLITKFLLSTPDNTSITALSTVSIIDTFVKSVFIVWQAVLIANIIVDEFKSKTALLLFSYPIKRNHILASKLLLTVVLTFGGMLITMVFVNMTMLALNMVLPFIDYHISINDIILLGITTITSICMGMTPLFIGMLNKSTVTTVVSSIAIVSLTVGTGIGDGARMINILPVSFVLGVIGISLAYIAIKKISTDDTTF